MINLVCCCVVVDNCDQTPEQLRGAIRYLLHERGEGVRSTQDIKVIEGYYPKQRIIVVHTPERVKEIIAIIADINNREFYE